jgi:hypothetical protein
VERLVQLTTQQQLARALLRFALFASALLILSPLSFASACFFNADADAEGSPAGFGTTSSTFLQCQIMRKLLFHQKARKVI